jgi:transposase-like protein
MYKAKPKEVRSMPGVFRSPEEKQKLIAAAKELMNGPENISVAKACAKAGLSVSNYYAWNKKKGKTGKRKKRKPIVETALVPINPTTQDRLTDDVNSATDGGNNRPTMAQAVELLGRMNAASLATLLQGRM